MTSVTSSHAISTRIAQRTSPTSTFVEIRRFGLPLRANGAILRGVAERVNGFDCPTPAGVRPRRLSPTRCRATGASEQALTTAGRGQTAVSAHRSAQKERAIIMSESRMFRTVSSPLRLHAGVDAPEDADARDALHGGRGRGRRVPLAPRRPARAERAAEYADTLVPPGRQGDRHALVRAQRPRGRRNPWRETSRSDSVDARVPVRVVGLHIRKPHSGAVARRSGEPRRGRRLCGAAPAREPERLVHGPPSSRPRRQQLRLRPEDGRCGVGCVRWALRTSSSPRASRSDAPVHLLPNQRIASSSLVPRSIPN